MFFLFFVPPWLSVSLVTMCASVEVIPGGSIQTLYGLSVHYGYYASGILSLYKQSEVVERKHRHIIEVGLDI